MNGGRMMSVEEGVGGRVEHVFVGVETVIACGGKSELVCIHAYTHTHIRIHAGVRKTAPKILTNTQNFVVVATQVKMICSVIWFWKSLRI